MGKNFDSNINYNRFYYFEKFFNAQFKLFKKIKKHIILIIK